MARGAKAEPAFPEVIMLTNGSTFATGVYPLEFLRTAVSDPSFDPKYSLKISAKACISCKIRFEGAPRRAPQLYSPVLNPPKS